ncbi:MAG: hypothetical protein IPH49_12800 [Ignavibacteria bacterium]|nr:hypothetical protein [Ignavibacteria bacterium]
MKQLLLLVAFVAFARPIAAQTLSGEEIAHQWNRCVIEVIMEDGFGPPIAARIHAYSNLAGYQAAYHAEPTYISMVGKLNGFTSCPEPDQKLAYDWRVAPLPPIRWPAASCCIVQGSQTVWLPCISRDWRRMWLRMCSLDQKTTA